MNDRLKCVEKLDGMNTLLSNIKMQWDNRHYPTLDVLKKIERLQENISDFNHFYLIYIARIEDDMKDYKISATILGLTPEQNFELKKERIKWL